jgi:hypothetical protein
VRAPVLALLLLSIGLLIRASSVAASSPDPGHVTNLPPLSAGTLMDAAPGEAPSQAHPHGTVLVAASLARCGPAIYEWDVAGARVMREACLGGRQANVRVVRRGGALLVLTVGPDVVLRQIDVASFRVTGRTRLGEYASSGIAEGDGFTVVLSGPSPGSYADTFTVTTLDAAGHALARVTSPGKNEWGAEPRVEVLAHRAFFVLDADGSREPRPRLVAVDATAHVVGTLALDGATAGTPSIAVKNDRLLVALGREVLEVSPQLAVLARHPLGTYGSLAVAQDGRVLTGSGQLFSNDFSPVGQLLGREAWEHAVLWVGPIAVVLGTDAEVVSGARIHWWEL